MGGQDETVIAPRHDGWFAPLIVIPGVQTPDGPSVAGKIIAKRRHQCHITIDMGGGYGGSTYDHLKDSLDPSMLHAHKGAAASVRRTKDKQLGFYNKRAEICWRFREALDPGEYQGSPVALPRDPMLLSDLTAITFKYVRGPGGGMIIKLIPKDQLVKKLGRSTDRGDAVQMSWAYGPKASTHIQEWREDQRTGNMMGRKRRPKVNLRRRPRTRRR